MLHAVVMAGGSGTRFWPQSRRSRPKQFLQFTGEHTLLQDTLRRVSSWIPVGQQWVVTNQRHATETAKQLPLLDPRHILAEPCGRNTAPCIGWAAVRLLHEDPEAVMLVMPADHVIETAAEFEQAIVAAQQTLTAHPDGLILFGVPPTYPATGFGYIERGAPLAGGNRAAAHVEAFKEKPARPLAEEYVRAGRYFWNCGIFLWRAQTIVDALQANQPAIAAILDELRPTIGTPSEATAVEELFPRMPSISIDYAVLEKSAAVYVHEAPFEWDDVGSWRALARMLPPDEQGNTVMGLHCGLETQQCVIRSTPEHLVATIGLEGCVVVHTPHATLVAKKDDDDSIRKLIEMLAKEGYEGFL